jgi:DNA-binding CsgD family transcriptional regulator
MLHITHFVLILSLAVGLAAITVSTQMYRRHRLGYLRAHLCIVIAFNLMIFISIVALYIFNLPDGTLSEGAANAVGKGYEFAIPLLQLFAAYFFLQIVKGLLGTTVGGNVRSIGWAIVGAYGAIQTMALATSIVIGGVRLSQIVARGVWFFSLGAIYIMLIAHLPQVGRIEESDRRKALKAYWYLILGLMTVAVVLILLSNAGLLEITRYNFVTGFLILAMNAIPVLYVRWFVERFHGRPLLESKMSPDRTQLFERYNVTPREQEIVTLICKGKTNREIADQLFISLQTVKDHVYRIYRKTGVRNRVQLVTLFMQSES